MQGHIPKGHAARKSQFLPIQTDREMERHEIGPGSIGKTQAGAKLRDRCPRRARL
ncbi:hypothetical protein MACH21_10570 [Roseicyclus marinus]|uniref:Uncharacterized protein n=1 Tax=Roseicyclus marinus TaxID=2161673 RepID=A0AA48HBS5_9RHOB|nr:hypothetical protein MACH21_10570 [Roseicyclus marinus]